MSRKNVKKFIEDMINRVLSDTAQFWDTIQTAANADKADPVLLINKLTGK